MFDLDLEGIAWRVLRDLGAGRISIEEAQTVT
jgi:hypothetical protein